VNPKVSKFLSPLVPTDVNRRKKGYDVTSKVLTIKYELVKKVSYGALEKFILL